jgi:DNA-binding MarR family transcriptional regulator
MTPPGTTTKARTGVDGSTVNQELAGRLRLSVNRLQRRLRQQSLAGLSPAQVSALGSVSRLGNPTLGELATIELVQPPTMTRIVASLADAGMVTRVTDVTDRRSARVQVTPAGTLALEHIRTLKDAFLVGRLGQLSPVEQKKVGDLVELLEHLLAEP